MTTSITDVQEVVASGHRPHREAPSDIFSHYKEQEAHEKEQMKVTDMERVKQGEAPGVNGENMNATQNFYRAKDDFAANKARNQGSGAPFAVESSRIATKVLSSSSENRKPVICTDVHDFLTPRERQAGNPNLKKDTFNSLFGDSPETIPDRNRAKGKASTHNPVTWEAYSNYDAAADKPAHRSRYATHASAKQGGNDIMNVADSQHQGKE